MTNKEFPLDGPAALAAWLKGETIQNELLDSFTKHEQVLGLPDASTLLLYQWRIIPKPLVCPNCGDAVEAHPDHERWYCLCVHCDLSSPAGKTQDEAESLFRRIKMEEP